MRTSSIRPSQNVPAAMSLPQPKFRPSEQAAGDERRRLHGHGGQRAEAAILRLQPQLLFCSRSYGRFTWLREPGLDDALIGIFICSNIDNWGQPVARIRHRMLILESWAPIQINRKQFCRVTVFIEITTIGGYSRIVTRINTG
jgi:hypothetical protein